MNAASVQQQVSELMSNGQYARARDVLMRLLPKSAANPSILDALAVIHLHLGEHERALYFSTSAVAAGPTAAQFLITHSNVLSALGRHEDSVTAAQSALRAEPQNPAALAVLSVALRQAGRFAMAEEVGRRAVHAAPLDELARANLASMLIYMGKPREAIALAEEIPPGGNSSTVHIAAATAANYIDDMDPAQIAALHRHAGQSVMPATVEPYRAPSPATGELLRVGIVSSDLRRHSVASFAAALIRGHDRSAMQLMIYSTGTEQDDETRRLMEFGGTWRSCGTLSDESLARKIREDQLDVLIDLHGLSAGHRMGVFAARCAPVQITYCGYPNSTGVPAMDVRLVDRITDPEECDPSCSERLVRLGRCFLCYTPTPQALAIDLEARHRAPHQRPITFGSFNAFQKISDRTIALWARALQRHSGSRMILKAGAFKDTELVQSVIARFGLHGIAADRLDLRPPVPGLSGHLDSYKDMDVALDTWPYNGTTTTCEALTMGTPVVTLMGVTHASRVGASILTAARCGAWIAKTDADWDAAIDRAVSNVQGAAWSGEQLREQVLRSSLCDDRDWNEAFLVALKDCVRSRIK